MIYSIYYDQKLDIKIPNCIKNEYRNITKLNKKDIENIYEIKRKH